MMDYKYELLEKTTIVRTTTNKILDIIEEAMNDPYLSLDDKWECLEYYPHIENNNILPDFDLDVFQRFNIDYDRLEQEIHSGVLPNYIESNMDTVGWNYITSTISMLEETRKPIPGQTMYAWDLIKLVEELMLEDKLTFYKEYEKEIIDKDGNETIEWEEEVLIFTKIDLKKAKEYIINKRLFKFKYKVDYDCN